MRKKKKEKEKMITITTQLIAFPSSQKSFKFQLVSQTHL